MATMEENASTTDIISHTMSSPDGGPRPSFSNRASYGTFGSRSYKDATPALSDLGQVVASHDSSAVKLSVESPPPNKANAIDAISSTAPLLDKRFQVNATSRTAKRIPPPLILTPRPGLSQSTGVATGTQDEQWAEPEEEVEAMNPTPTPTQKNSQDGFHNRNRSQNKLDKVLGAGAGVAHQRLEAETIALRRIPGEGNQSSSQIKPTTTSVKANHRHSTSWSYSPLALTRGREATSLSPAEPEESESLSSPGRGRSRSIDSVASSLRPSLSDSITTMTRLLPMSKPSAEGLPRPLVSPLSESRTPVPGIPNDLSMKNNLDQQQRAMLVRRTRKLEQLLGESINEKNVEALIVGPTTTSTTILTKSEEGIRSGGSSSPTTDYKLGLHAGLASRPEWEKDDCVPQVQSAPSSPRAAQSIARRALVALGLDRKAETDKDLEVYVKREMTVTESGMREVNKVKAATQQITPEKRDQRRPPSPARSVRDTKREEGDAESDRRLRIAQLAKSRYDGDDVPTPGWGEKLRQRLKASMGRRNSISSIGASLSPKETDAEDPFFILAREPFSEEEKALARKKAHKLENVFGRTPPQYLYLNQIKLRNADTPVSHSSIRPRHSRSQSALPDSLPQLRPLSQTSFEAYERSLQGLLYLADNDQPLLENLIDRLSIEPGSGSAPGSNSQPRSSKWQYSPIASRTQETRAIPVHQIQAPEAVKYDNLDDDLGDIPVPMPDPQSHSARRRRTGKLSAFFGETGIDFSHPPNIPQTLEKANASGAGAGSGEGAKRIETLDRVLGEMWRAVQGEVRKGGMGVTEGERLGEMIGVLRWGRQGEWTQLGSKS